MAQNISDSQGIQVGSGNIQINNWGPKSPLDPALLGALKPDVALARLRALSHEEQVDFFAGANPADVSEILDAYVIADAQAALAILTDLKTRAALAFDPVRHPLDGLPVGYGRGASEVALSPDGRRLAGVFLDEIRVWDTTTGRAIVWPLPSDGEASMLTFSPDGHYLVARLGASDAVARLDLSNGRQTGPAVGFTSRGISGDFRSEITISPDARFLALNRGTNLLLWSLTSRTAEPRTIRRQIGHVFSSGFYFSNLAFSVNGARLAASFGRDVHVWETQTLDHAMRPLKHRGDVQGIGFSPNGRLIATRSKNASGSGERVCIWDTSRELPAVWHADEHTAFGSLTTMCFTPDSRILAVVERGTSDKENRVHLWDVTARRHLGKVLEARWPSFSPDGATMAALRDYKIHFWETATQCDSPALLPGQVTGYVHRVVFSQDWRLMVTHMPSSDDVPSILLWRARRVLLRPRGRRTTDLPTLRCLDIASDCCDVRAEHPNPASA